MINTVAQDSLHIPIYKDINQDNFSLSFSHVFVDIEEKNILSEININLTEKFIGIVGNNGSGKSTFARVACGLQKIRNSKTTIHKTNPTGNLAPCLSEIHIHNKSIRSLKKDTWRYINMTFQIPEQQIIMPNVKDEIEFGLKHCGFSQEIIQEKVDFALTILQVKEDHPCHTLSSGKKRMLCLLTILLLEPETIILDEPTTFLDPPTKIQFMEFIHQIPQQIIIITHDFHIIENFPRVLCFDKGRIIADDNYKTCIEAYKSIW